MGIRLHFPTVLSSACGTLPQGKKCGSIYLNDQIMPRHDLWREWMEEYRTNPETVTKRLILNGLEEQVEILEARAAAG